VDLEQSRERLARDAVVLRRDFAGHLPLAVGWSDNELKQGVFKAQVSSRDWFGGEKYGGDASLLKNS
jgi:hypothetical protein